MKLMILITLLCCLIYSDALPSGAPASACSTLTPVHSGITAQQSPPPFNITVVKSGDAYEVTISAPIGEEFEGFILQARSSSNPSTFIDGQFTANQMTKAIDCFKGTKNTLTHVNATPKKEVKAEWTPKESVPEDIIFRATVAKTFDKFWTEVDSSPVKVEGSMPVSEEEMHVLPASVSTNICSNKPCVTLPSDCVERQDCKVIFSWSKPTSDNVLTFELHGNLDSSNYMAMALSEDDAMGSDSVVECIKEGNSVIARESWNEGKSNTRTKELPRESYNVSVTDGFTYCAWKRPYIFETNEKYDLIMQRYYVLLAEGAVADGRLQYHSSRIASKNAVNFTELVPVDVSGIDSENTDNYTLNQHVKGTEPPNSSSQFSVSLSLLAIFGLLYATERYSFGGLGLI